MDVEEENWILNTWYVINSLIGTLIILCWLLWKRLTNRNNHEVGPNLRLQQTSVPDARNASDTTYPNGQVEPVQSSTD